jgi:hypothetical protein
VRDEAALKDVAGTLKHSELGSAARDDVVEFA